MCEASSATAKRMFGRLAALTGEDRYARAAERTLELFFPLMREYPAGFASMALALDEAIVPPSVLVLRGDPDALSEWTAQLARELLPTTQVVAISNGVKGLPPALDKPERPEPVNGWLCQGVTCLAPMSDLENLKAACKQPVMG